jgi:hypothetical protein
MRDTHNVIYSYSLQQAVEDGVLVEVFKDRWGELSGGKPIVATSHVIVNLSLAAVREIWNTYVDWKLRVESTLPEVERLFSTSMNGEKVWVLEDGDAYTILYPEDA